MLTHDQLVTAFKTAVDAATKADPGAQADGGACNLDALLIYPGRRSIALLKAAAEAGVTLQSGRRYGKAVFYVDVPAHGQADRRTKMIRAAREALQPLIEPEFQVSIHYAMD